MFRDQARDIFMLLTLTKCPQKCENGRINFLNCLFLSSRFSEVFSYIYVNVLHAIQLLGLNLLWHTKKSIKPFSKRETHFMTWAKRTNQVNWKFGWWDMGNEQNKPG